MTTYEKNIAALKEYQPHLHAWLEKQPDKIEWLTKTEDNLLLRVGNRSRLVYDEHSKKQVADIKNITVTHRENVTVFVGMGLGDAQAKILKVMEKGHVIFVVETEGQVIRWAFERHDFTKAIKENALLICVGEDEVSVHLPMIESHRIVEEWFLIVEPYCRERREYLKLIAHTQQIINQLRCNTGTVMGSGAKIADNDIATLPYVIRHRGVNELRDMYKGKPAVLVSTGPSLARNIHLLKDARDKIVIIAVAQALRPLLAYDIRPDFICTVDFGEVNMSHLAGLLDADVPLVTINRAYAPLVKSYKGPKFICAYVEPAFEKTAHAALAGKGTIEQGGSVAHMVFGLGLHLGCEPLIFVGQDLALTDGKSHFNQADSSGVVSLNEHGEIRWKVSDHRSTLHEGDFSMGEAQYIPGYYGEPVMTNVGLLSFLTTFEALVKFCGRKVVNATEGGARIYGAEPLFLDEALEKYGTENINKTAVADLLTLATDADEQVKRAIPLLEYDIKGLKDIIRLSDESITYSNKLLKAQSTPRIKELLTQHTTVTAEAEKISRGNPLIGLAIYWAQRRIMHRDMLNSKTRTTATHLIKNKADLRVRINRSLTIIKAAKEAAESLLKTYEESLSALNRYLEWMKDSGPSLGMTSPLDPIGEISPPNLDDAEDMLTAGNWAKPLLEVRRFYELTSPMNDVLHAMDIEDRAKEIREKQIAASDAIRAADKKEGRDKLPMFFKLLEDSQEAGRSKDYEKAEECARKAMDLMPERSEGKWGLASALHMKGDIDKSLKAYDELIEKFPDKSDYRFERAMVRIRAGMVNEAFADFGNLFAESERYDHMLKTIGTICKALGLKDRAHVAFDEYNKKYPGDAEVEAELARA